MSDTYNAAHGIEPFPALQHQNYPSRDEFIARWVVQPTVIRNFNLPMLLSMAERFNFKVDVRGPWPIMIRGLHAAVYTTHRDALHFISKEMV
jgi:hypothetical protein